MLINDRFFYLLRNPLLNQHHLRAKKQAIIASKQSPRVWDARIKSFRLRYVDTPSTADLDSNYTLEMLAFQTATEHAKMSKINHARQDALSSLIILKFKAVF